MEEKSPETQRRAGPHAMPSFLVLDIHADTKHRKMKKRLTRKCSSKRMIHSNNPKLDADVFSFIKNWDCRPQTTPVIINTLSQFSPLCEAQSKFVRSGEAAQHAPNWATNSRPQKSSKSIHIPRKSFKNYRTLSCIAISICHVFLHQNYASNRWVFVFCSLLA